MTSAVDPAHQHTFPAGQALQLVELVKRWNVEPAALLEPFGVTQAQLEAPDARLGLSTIVEMTDRARKLTGEPGLGVYLGLAKHVSAYGFVGFAAMSAATLGEALQQSVELAPALTTTLSLSLRVEGDMAALVLLQHADIEPILDVALLSFFVGLHQIARDITGRRPYFGTVELTIPEPAYWHRFTEVLPAVRFDQPVNQLVFPALGLDLPLVHPNRATLNLARKHCLDQLAQLGFDASLAARARRALAHDDGFRSLEELAAALGVSARTLKRRLAEHGMTYSQLLQEERQVRASHLLRATELSLDEIAVRLGYATTSNFTRAFTRWTGSSPAAHRRAVRGCTLIDAGGGLASE